MSHLSGDGKSDRRRSLEDLDAEVRARGVNHAREWRPGGFDDTNLKACPEIQAAVDVLNGKGSDAAKARAAGKLDKFAHEPSKKYALYKAGAIPALVEVIRSGSHSGKESACGAVSYLSYNNEDVKSEVVRAGAIGPLVALLRSGSEGGMEHAAAALRNLSYGAEKGHAAISEAMLQYKLAQDEKLLRQIIRNLRLH